MRGCFEFKVHRKGVSVIGKIATAGRTHMDTEPSNVETELTGGQFGREADLSTCAPIEAIAALDDKIQQLSAEVERDGTESPWSERSARLHDEIIECRMQKLAYEKVLLAQHMGLKNRHSSRGEAMPGLSSIVALTRLASATIALAEAYACGFYLEQCSKHLRSATRITEVDIPAFIESDGDIAVVEALQERLQADIAGCQGFACYQALIMNQQRTEAIGSCDNPAAGTFEEVRSNNGDRLACSLDVKVLDILNASLNQIRRGYSDRDLRCARIHELIAKTCTLKMQNPQEDGLDVESLDLALEHYQLAETIRAERFGTHSKPALEISLGVAQTKMAAGFREEAVQIMTMILRTIDWEASDVEPSFIIDNILRLSHWTSTSEDSGTDATTTEMLIKARELAVKNYVATDRRVVDITRDLALRAVKSEDFVNARYHLSEILEVERKLHGHYSIPVCRTLNALGSVLMAIGDGEDALSILSKAKLIAEGLLSSERRLESRESLTELLQSIERKLSDHGQV
ncbi:hypothetical protein FOL47_003516 [Perkinsus chesapeaki]|uniref:Uncharacterized protein n=1 Tax=Perkinsus chesapeaki TaxID=330153 RepID=A0A7J6MZP6_PERCH|nr:hypothetical protein FOL47_003516 [Perkinsus chesapeaki]